MTTVREEIAWLIVERMEDAVGFDEVYQEVGDYLKIIEKRIDSLKQECNGMPDYIDAYNKVKEILK